MYYQNMLVNKNRTDYTTPAILMNNEIVKRFGYTARITRIWEFLTVALLIPKFEILDLNSISPDFESYIIDRYIDWSNGKDVNLKDIQDAILVAGDFTKNEKILIENPEMEDKLWGIFLAVSNPDRIIENK